MPFLCLPPDVPLPPLLTNSLGVARFLLLLGKPISQSSQLRLAFSLPLLTKPMALDTLLTLDKALADVAVSARDTCEEPFQP